MLRISDSTFSLFARSASDSFVKTLAADLRGAYPERFAFTTEADLERYVTIRIDYCAQFGLTRQDCVAALAHAECRSMADFLRDHQDSWWAGILERDVPQDLKAHEMLDQIDHLEIDEGFAGVI